MGQKYFTHQQLVFIISRRVHHNRLSALATYPINKLILLSRGFLIRPLQRTSHRSAQETLIHIYTITPNLLCKYQIYPFHRKPKLKNRVRFVLFFLYSVFPECLSFPNLILSLNLSLVSLAREIRTYLYTPITVLCIYIELLRFNWLAKTMTMLTQQPLDVSFSAFNFALCCYIYA